MSIHFNIEDLLSARTVESDRIEYKQGWNPDAIYRSICDTLLEKLLDYCELNHAEFMYSTIAGIQAGTIAKDIKTIENQTNEVMGAVSSTIASTIAGAIVTTIAENERIVLTLARQPEDRETLLSRIGVSNQRKNHDRYMLPLINKGWLTMTIPDKPTSPNQKYLTTLKGRLVLKFLKSA